MNLNNEIATLRAQRIIEDEIFAALKEHDLRDDNMRFVSVRSIASQVARRAVLELLWHNNISIVEGHGP